MTTKWAEVRSENSEELHYFKKNKKFLLKFDFVLTTIVLSDGFLSETVLYLWIPHDSHLVQKRSQGFSFNSPPLLLSAVAVVIQTLFI